jgi:hypothetical protein
MQITITEKELKKSYPTATGKDYKHTFSPSGTLIDELAYCAKQWTQDELHDNNYEYELSVPYDYNYEEDLFEATKTQDELNKLAELLDMPCTLAQEKTNLQAGAYMALNNPLQWGELLQAYTEKLKEDRTEGISKKYNEALQEEIDEYYESQYKQWLYGDRDYAGVIKEIAKYFTNNRDGEYNKKDDEYTFILDEYDIEKAESEGYNKRQLKKWLLDSIRNAGEAREWKEKQEREKRKAERERLMEYKKQQVEQAEAERKAKLLSMTLK